MVALDKNARECQAFYQSLGSLDSWKVLSESSLLSLNKSGGLGLNSIGRKTRRRSGDAKRFGPVEENDSMIALFDV